MWTHAANVTQTHRICSKGDVASLLSWVKALSHFTGLAKPMGTKQSPLKHINACFLYGYHSAYMFHVHYMSDDVRQILCSISHQNNNGQEYLLSGFVHYINPVWCERGLTYPCLCSENKAVLFPKLSLSLAHAQWNACSWVVLWAECDYCLIVAAAGAVTRR